MSKSITFVSPTNVSSIPSIHHLSPVDYVMPRWYTRTALCYRYLPLPAAEPSFLETVNHLRSSLSSVLSEYPILAGRLHLDYTSGRLWVQLPPDERTKQFGARFVVSKLSGGEGVSFPSFAELDERNFPLSMLPADILSPVGGRPESGWEGQGAETLAVQVNLINGGLIIVVCTHHSVCDGMGHASFIRRWAELSKRVVCGFGEDINSRDPSIHDRSPLMSDHESWITVPQQGHEAYIVKSAPETVLPQATLPTIPPMQSVIFHITPEKVQLLKSECTGLDKSAAPVSANSAISALFWRVVSRVRLGVEGVSDNERITSMLGMAVNARSRLDPPLHEDYFGNVNIYSATVLPLSTLVSPATRLSAVALSVHESVGKMNNNSVRSTIQFLHSVKYPSHVDHGFNTFLGKDVAITSWVHMGIYGRGGDFGFGELVRVRPPYVDFDGIGFILPRNNAEGEGLELLVGLEKGCMLRMRQDGEWRRFFDVQAV